MESVARAVEISELEFRKLLLEELDHLCNSHPFSFPHHLQIEVGIDIEIPHLNQVKLCGADQFDQPLDLALSIGEPGKNEKIDGSVETFFFRLHEGLDNASKSIMLGSVVSVIEAWMGAVEGHANTVEPCVAEPPDPLGETSVRVEVNRSLIGFLTKELDRSFQEASLEEGFALTPLAEADDSVFRLLEMG